MHADYTDATKAMDEAILKVRDFADGYIKQYGTNIDALVRIMHSNRATWSGGPTNPTNIMETLIREKAEAKLFSIIHRNRLGDQS